MTFGSPNSIRVKYDAAAVQNMLNLLKVAPFPDRAPIDASEPWKLGMDYDYLKRLKDMFLTEWSWDSLEKRIATFDNYLVHYEHEGDSLGLHYIHVKSSRADAIPLILLHGWPGPSSLRFRFVLYLTRNFRQFFRLPQGHRTIDKSSQS